MIWALFLMGIWLTVALINLHKARMDYRALLVKLEATKSELDYIRDSRDKLRMGKVLPYDSNVHIPRRTDHWSNQ